MENTQFFAQKRILLTGGAGFIGSHLAEVLLSLGAEVTAVDNLLTGSEHNIAHLQSVSKFRFIKADVTSSPETYLASDFLPDVILHFASPASPPLYQKHPIETYLVNSLATHTLLQYIVHKSPVTRFLFASTSEVYGDPQQHPQAESYFGNVNPNGIRSCYDEAKRLGETICGVHARDLNVDTRIVRIFNTYGPRMDLNDGRVIPQFMKQLLHHQPFSIYGDGTQTRSYCYVSDLVEGILRFVAADGLQGETINLGNPEEHTILETAQVIQSLVTEVKPELEFHPLPKDDPTRRRPDISKAEKLLNWHPRVELVQGLEQTLKYFQDYV